MTQSAYTFDTVPWSSLTITDRAAWARIRADRADLKSPFFSLGWHDAVQEARSGVEVVRISQLGKPVGYLPFNRCPFGMLRPVGAPMSDWHGVVGPTDLTLDQDAILQAARGKAFRFSGAAAGDPVLGQAQASVTTSHVMDLTGGYEAYVQEAASAHPKAFRNLRARSRKLADRRVEVRLDDRAGSSLTKVLEMKRDQYRRTRQVDIFGFRWTRRLSDLLVARPASSDPEGARGLLSTLWIDGDLAAGHLGLLSSKELHYWFPVYDDRYSEFSPGIALLHEIARGSSELGVSRIDLGDGDYRFKQEFANRQVPALSGTARTSGRIGRRLSLSTSNPDDPSLPDRGIARVSHALKRRVDLLSDLHRW